MDELSLFAAAIAETDPTQRVMLLDRQCSGRPDLRQRIDDLLDAHLKSNPMLDQTIGESAATAAVPGARAGTVIAGRFKLLEEIGQGGMGTVWVAEQTAPVRRKVALKLIKAGMDSKSVIARFEAERQALAMMDHPNIAKVLDGGLTEMGRPYFVMEYVKGVPITEYSDSARLSVHERLALFAQVCQAVQHAHQKGIIHRDLKPSNVLVAPYDDKPVPKIIDFGLAKAMHQSLTEKTLFTAHESVMGTPLYMSPEQAQLNNLDVDTRSDIYSLGVLLYELLTGTTPLEKARFNEAAWDEIRRIIREEEPPRPSTRLSSTNTLPSLAACRHTEPLKLTKQVRGELDWIVMKALEKDRTRRYETANGLARDIHRYLTDEPVEACPPSTTYRLRKFARKYRASLTTAATIAILLIGGIAVSSWQAVRATRAEGSARASAEAERLAKQDAEDRRAEAEQQKTRAVAGETLAKDRLVQVEAEKKRAEQAAAAEKAARTDAETGRAQALEQKIRAEAGEKLASARLESIWRVGAVNTAINHATRAKRLLANGQADEALALFRKAVERNPGCEFGRDPECLLSDAELKLFQTRLGVEHPETLRIMSGLAAVHLSAGRRDIALPLYEQVLKLRESALGREDPETLQSMLNLAAAYRVAGKFDQALVLGVEALRLRRTRFGADHPETLASMHELAATHRAAGSLDTCIQLFEETLSLRKSQLGLNHPDTALTTVHLAWAYDAAGRFDQSLPLYEESLQQARTNFNPDHPYYVGAMKSLYAAYLKAGARDNARRLLPELLASTRKQFPADSPQLAGQLASIATASLRGGAFTEAEPLLRECLAIRQKSEPELWTTFSTQAMLGRALLGQRKYGDAEPLLLAGYEGMKRREKTIPAEGRIRLTEAAGRLVELYTALDKPDDVEKWRAERAKYPAATNPATPSTPTGDKK